VVALGTISRWTGSQWQQLPGDAQDIDIGANGTVWMVGNGGSNSGTGWAINKWTGSGWQMDTGNVGGNYIAVDPSGNPWVTDWDNNIFARIGTSSTSNPPSGGGTTTTTPTTTPTPPTPFDLVARDAFWIVQGMKTVDFNLIVAGLWDLLGVLNNNPSLQPQLLMAFLTDVMTDL
jgi:hypothetical protein